MRIAINVRFLLSGKMEGIGWYTYETVRRMVEAHPEHEFHFLFDRKWSEEFIFTDNVIPHRVNPPARHPYLWYWWFEKAVPGQLKKIKPDVFFSPDGFMSLHTEVPTLMVMHDLAFEHFPKHVPKLVRRYYQYFSPRYARKAARIAAVSQATKDDIVAHYNIDPDKIMVAHNGVREDFQPMSAREKEDFRHEKTKSRPYLFFVGAMHPRKNIPRLIEAYTAFRHQVKGDPLLLLTGRMAWMTADIKKAYDASEFKEDIVFTGHLDSQELAKYTAAASIICYLSLFEGFGVPVLEAMQAEVPLLCSNVSSIPEVAGDAALYADPHDLDAMTEGMITLWNDHELAAELVDNGRRQRQHFSWDATAGKLWSAIKDIGLPG